MTRADRIHAALVELAQHGVINPDYYSSSPGGARRWVFTPTGFSERALTTSQIEDFILGARAALAAQKATS